MQTLDRHKLGDKNMKEGFTLIEIILAITIVAILMLGAFFSYVTLYSHSNVASGIQIVEYAVKQAQDDAIDEYKGYSEYGVYFDNNTVTIFPGTTYTQGSSTNVVYALPFAIEITNINPTDHNPIIFDGVNGQLGNDGLSVTIGNSNFVNTININQNGAISQ